MQLIGDVTEIMSAERLQWMRDDDLEAFRNQSGKFAWAASGPNPKREFPAWAKVLQQRFKPQEKFH